MAAAIRDRISVRESRLARSLVQSYRRCVEISRGHGALAANESRASQCFDAPERRRTFARSHPRASSISVSNPRSVGRDTRTTTVTISRLSNLSPRDARAKGKDHPGQFAYVLSPPSSFTLLPSLRS